MKQLSDTIGLQIYYSYSSFVHSRQKKQSKQSEEGEDVEETVLQLSSDILIQLLFDIRFIAKMLPLSANTMQNLVSLDKDTMVPHVDQVIWQLCKDEFKDIVNDSVQRHALLYMFALPIVSTGKKQKQHVEASFVNIAEPIAPFSYLPISQKKKQETPVSDALDYGAQYEQPMPHTKHTQQNSSNSSDGLFGSLLRSLSQPQPQQQPQATPQEQQPKSRFNIFSNIFSN